MRRSRGVAANTRAQTYRRVQTEDSDYEPDESDLSSSSESESDEGSNRSEPVARHSHALPTRDIGPPSILETFNITRQGFRKSMALLVGSDKLAFL